MQSHLTQVTSQLSALAKSGRIVCARKLFDELPHRDTIAWNAMLSGYSQLGLHRKAILLFSQMRISNCKPDNYTFTSALSASAGLPNLLCGQTLHALAVILGYTAFLPINNALIDMYGKCKSAHEAYRAFEDMDSKNEVSWCSLLFAYVNAGHFDMASSVFSAMPKRVLVAWNTMISAHAKTGEVKLCFELFRKMLEDACRPDQCTMSALMNACAEGSNSCYGSIMHGFIFKCGWSSAVEEAPEKNVISWTCVIAGYARNGNEEQAISLFIDMIRSGLKPDDFTFGAVLHACSSLATLGQGKMVHGCVIQSGFLAYSYVCNGLLNLYAKCGDIIDSCKIFGDIDVRDLISWNTMLFAHGLYGLSSQAFQLFETMVASGMKPDKVTFIGLLMTCSHSGLLEKGRSIFESMSAIHGISPDIDHVACMVDMLGRAGHLKEARELTKKYLDSQSDRISSYEVLFGACSGQGNTEMGAELGEQLQVLEPKNEMSYVLLSNMYCASGQWTKAEMLRRDMAHQEVKKVPGISWIELKNEMAYFFAGTQLNAEMKEFSDVSSILDSEMRHPIATPFWE